MPAALGVATADPEGTVVALSGDYDFQFMVEELAVGAQFNIPYIHVLVNNAYLGLIRQSQRGFKMDYCVQLSFDNINAPEVNGYGVDHVKVVEGLGCKAIRVFEPDEILPALEQAKKMLVEHRVPVVVEVILERVTNVSMGLEIDNITEFEELAESGGRCPDRALRQPRLTQSTRTVLMPRVLLAPDKFKGTLTAAAVADHLAAGIRSVRPDVEIVVVPVSDGGDGLLEALGRAGFDAGAGAGVGTDGRARRHVVRASRASEAVIEMAEVCGLGRLPDGELAPATATSRGVGEVVAEALDAGCTEILIGIGGSASTDGGAGMVRALGARVLDAAGDELDEGGEALGSVARLDLSGLASATGGGEHLASPATSTTRSRVRPVRPRCTDRRRVPGRTWSPPSTGR